MPLLWAAQTGKHLLQTQNVSEQNQKHFPCPGHKICVRNKCCARGQTGKHLCRQQCVLVCQGLWNDHIDLISTKISSRLVMARKAREVPREVGVTLNDTMILPLFDSCSANRDYLDKLQRRAVSIIEGRKIQHHHQLAIII